MEGLIISRWLDYFIAC